jgi:hypothetical protein
MTSATLKDPATTPTGTSVRANALAERLENGMRALASLAKGLSDAEWNTPIPHDGRTVGVIVHHVGNMYPLEIQAAQTLADGKPLVGITPADVDQINAAHAREFKNVTKAVAVEFLVRNGEAAAAAIRTLTDAQLDRAASVSLNSDAPLTCQFVLEDHAVRHSYHHLAKIKAALKRGDR